LRASLNRGKSEIACIPETGKNTIGIFIDQRVENARLKRRKFHRNDTVHVFIRLHDDSVQVLLLSLAFISPCLRPRLQHKKSIQSKKEGEKNTSMDNKAKA
jgi:hypothetical protein